MSKEMDSSFVLVEEKKTVFAVVDIREEKYEQVFVALATRIEAINALYKELQNAEQRWQKAFGELQNYVTGLGTDEERWAFVTALARLNAKKQRVRAAEEADIEFVYDYFYQSEGYESTQASWDGALALDPEALASIFRESVTADHWLAGLERASVVRVVGEGDPTAVLYWRPDDESVVVERGIVES